MIEKHKLYSDLEIELFNTSKFARLFLGKLQCIILRFFTENNKELLFPIAF